MRHALGKGKKAVENEPKAVFLDKVMLKVDERREAAPGRQSGVYAGLEVGTPPNSSQFGG
jgi:hypothetical protein